MSSQSSTSSSAGILALNLDIESDNLHEETKPRDLRARLLFKRVCDLIFAALLIVLFSPLMLVASILVKIQDGGPVFFRQERLTGGAGGPRIFRIFKFRTMVVDAEGLGGKITPKGDPRITAVGRILRGTKLDELPQLFNILTGDMSFVGPRPQTLGYVEHFRKHYLAIHSLIPAGLTDLATLKYRDEAAVLSTASDPQALYIQEIMPDKIRSHFEYLRQLGPWTDAKIVLQTVWTVFVLKPISKLRKH